MAPLAQNGSKGLDDHFLELGKMGGYARSIAAAGSGLNSEAPRGKPRGICAEPCEAKNAIPPCGKPQGFLAKKGKGGPALRSVLA